MIPHCRNGSINVPCDDICSHQMRNLKLILGPWGHPYWLWLLFMVTPQGHREERSH